MTRCTGRKRQRRARARRSRARVCRPVRANQAAPVANAPGCVSRGSEEHRRLVERIGDRVVAASISGGKDSAATSLYLTELGIEHRRVFADTRWESRLTYEYLHGELERVLGPIEVVCSESGGMPDLVRKKGMFPSRLARFCTQELKVRPIRDYLARLQDETGRETVNVVGIRWGESKARARMPEWERNDYFRSDTWRPILAWSEADVIAIHQRHGLRPNPLYLRGASRVGCWPCIFSRKAEIRLIADADAARVDELRGLEAEVQEQARKRYAARGETFESLGYSPPTFFHKHDACARTRNVSIDDVVTWSRTSHGGKQLEMFAPPRSELGCMRWGLCESDDPKDSVLDD